MDRPLHMILAVVCVMKSLEAAQVSRNYCGADQYYDGVEERCVECSAICLPDVESDFCFNNCREYYEKMVKERRPINPVQEAEPASEDTYYNSKSTTKHDAMTTVPEVPIVDDTPFTVVLILVVVTVCVGVTLVMLLIALISCRSCQHHSDLDYHDDGALCGCCLPLLGGIRRQQVERQIEKHLVNVASISDCSPPDSGIGSPLKLYESRVSDASEHRSLLQTQSLDGVSFPSSSPDDVKSPVTLTWSVSAPTAAGHVVIQYTAGPSPSPSPPPQTPITNSITQQSF